MVKGVVAEKGNDGGILVEAGVISVLFPVTYTIL